MLPKASEQYLDVIKQASSLTPSWLIILTISTTNNNRNKSDSFSNLMIFSEECVLGFCQRLGDIFTVFCVNFMKCG